MQPLNGGRQRLSAGHGEKFSRLKEQAIVALLTYPTVREAAEAAHVGERTLQRWLSLPGFTRRFEESKSRILAGTVNKLLRNGEAAADALVKLATSESTPAAARVRAAIAVIQLSLKWHSLSNIERQIAELQAAVAQIPQGRRVM